jgi:Fic family protein
MELFLPDQIVLNEASSSLLADVEETARRVNEYRPLLESVVKRIEDGLVGERVYSSNAIEGSTLDYRETVMVLNTGRILENKRREAIEARNLGKAVNKVQSLVGLNKKAHTLENLLEVHRLILLETPDDYWGGRFREVRVLIEAAKYQPPDHNLVPTLVDRVLERLGQSAVPSGLFKACWAHWALARIHPFKDGNGRIARLWQDLLLLQSKLTCAIITLQQRREYLEALTSADEGDFNPLVQLVSQRVLTTFDKYMAAIAADEELEDFAKKVAGEADARIADKRQLTYQRWARKMEQLRWEFEVCAARVTEASGRVRIQFSSYDLPDQAKWDLIRSGLAPKKTWFFSLYFDRGETCQRYIFFFGKHYPTADIDTADERSENRACILVSEDDGSGKGKRLDEVADCPITIRELFLVDDAFVVRRHNAVTGQTYYERGVAPMRIAQDFIREVVLHRLT